MHVANVSTAEIGGPAAAVDLRQTPAPLACLSFSASDLSALGAAHAARPGLPAMRLVALRDLAHPMSVDLWIDAVGRHARALCVRILGGHAAWAYGADSLAAVARRGGIALALLPGECSDRDERLEALSTLPRADLDALKAAFREGGPDNMAAVLARLARCAGADVPVPPVRPVARCGFWEGGVGVVPAAHFAGRRRVVFVAFYRSLLLAGDTDAVAALCAALAARGLSPVPLFVPSLKGADVAAFLADAAATLRPAAIVTTTAFAAAGEGDAAPLFEALGVPVFQAALATTARAAWAASPRGLVPADVAMHVVLPEVDGRVFAGAISFRPAPEPAPGGPHQFRPENHAPEASRVALAAARVAAVVRLRETPRAERRLCIVVPDYPGAEGRTGYAVGLDVPASVLAVLADLRAAGYRVDNVPATPRALMAQLETPRPAFSAAAAAAALDALPEPARAAISAAWGAPGPLRLRHARFGNVVVALAPDRGRLASRRADFHSPDLPPTPDLVAFGAFLRGAADVHALVHLGAHGTLEWLPGKAVALSDACFPELVLGPLPVVYPFIVSNPGEAAQAKRRIAAVTLGHLPPPVVGDGLSPDAVALERLVDEYAAADGLDAARRTRLERVILAEAARTGLDRAAGVAASGGPGAALKAIDAWLCDLKDFALKDGQHVFGRPDPVPAADPAEAARRAGSAAAEREALLAALDGRFVPPGPAGAPDRGRSDVHPTGRNLFALDPRALPTPTAFTVGAAAADEVLRFYAQEHGEPPGRLVVDLWGSASLRTGGEEIATALALMGCRPRWDHASGRVCGVEVLPLALVGRPRVDVTLRVSGLFRDLFPVQVALLVAAAGAVAARDFEGEENPLAAAIAAGGDGRRVFTSAPGTFGSGAEDLLQSGDWDERAAVGAAYLAAASHAFDAAGDAVPAAGLFAAQVEAADGLVHTGDDPGRDLLEGSADAAFVGGFAAAAAMLGSAADLVMLDTTRPGRPTARSLSRALARIVHARATNGRYVAAQMRHGPRGAADFAETVDRLVAFAETTRAVPPELIGAVFDAFVADAAVRDFLLRENPAAARAIARRFADARRRGLWHPLRNSVDADLLALAPAAAFGEAAE